LTDEKPWRLADLTFEPVGDGRREKATIDGIEIVREEGSTGSTPPTAWSDASEAEANGALNWLYGQKSSVIRADGVA
jgi:hypothetical protein